MTGRQRFCLLADLHDHPELRQQLRSLVDTETRRRRDEAHAKRQDLEQCRGCGGDMDSVTVGCVQCGNRAAKRRRQLQPDYVGRERERSRRRRLSRPSRAKAAT